MQLLGLLSLLWMLRASLELTGKGVSCGGRAGETFLMFQDKDVGEVGGLRGRDGG